MKLCDLCLIEKCLTESVGSWGYPYGGPRMELCPRHYSAFSRGGLTKTQKQTITKRVINEWVAQAKTATKVIQFAYDQAYADSAEGLAKRGAYNIDDAPLALPPITA